MTPTQAIQLVANATGQLRLTRDEHNQVAMALTILERLAVQDEHHNRPDVSDAPTNGELVAAGVDEPDSMPGRRSRRHK